MAAEEITAEVEMLSWVINIAFVLTALVHRLKLVLLYGQSYIT